MATALEAQQDRAVRFQHMLRKLGDRFYHPPEALLRQWNEFFLRFNGYTVAQNSLEYALLLLYGDDRVYGIDDTLEANRIIRRILEHQVLDTSDQYFGNFLWMTHWDRVKDRNAVSFLAPGLCHAYMKFGEKLEAETKAALELAFEPMLAGVFGHGATWSYSNIWALNLGATVALARIIGEEAPHDRAVASFDEWVEHTSEGGMHEFNSPTYSPVTMSGLEFAWAYTPDEDFRARLGRALDYLNYQLAVNLFPTGFPAGAASRAYLRDLIRGNTNGMYWAHVKFGTPLRDFPVAEQNQARLVCANYSLHDYVPPAIAREVATSHREDTILDRTIPLNSRRTHVMRQHWSLASQTVPRVRGHSPSPFLLLVRDTDAERASVVIAPDETFTHRPCAGFDAVQEGGVVVGRLHCEPTDEEREKAAADPEYICEPRVLFGRRDAITQVRVSNVDWGGAPVALEPGQAVAVAFDRLLVGLIAVPVDPMDGRMLLSYGEDDELRLSIVMFAAEQDPVDVAVLVSVSEMGPDESMRALTDDLLRHWQIEYANGVVTARNERVSKTLSTADADDAIGDALHISSAMTVMPGDLEAWIDGGRGLECLTGD